MNFLLLAALRVLDLDGEPLVALPAIGACRERARLERDVADVPGVGGRDRLRLLVIGEHGRGVRKVDVNWEGVFHEGRRGEIGLDGDNVSGSLLDACGT